MTYDNTPLTEEQVAATLDTHAGVRIGGVGEDGEWYIALGDVPRDRMLLAVMESTGLELGDLEGATREAGWSKFTPHSESCDDYDETERQELCSCDEYAWWGSGVHDNQRPGDIRATELRIL